METITYIASKEEENLFFQNTFTYITSNSEYDLDINPKVNNKNILLPLSIFSNGLSGLEGISKYLKEIIGLRYCQIADMLNRDDRTIWDAYRSAKQKNNGKFILEKSSFSIPLDIFSSRSLSILETLTTYLKEELNLRYCQIASLLNKNDRTVWTAYNRANKKRKNVNENK